MKVEDDKMCILMMAVPELNEFRQKPRNEALWGMNLSSADNLKKIKRYVKGCELVKFKVITCTAKGVAFLIKIINRKGYLEEYPEGYLYPVEKVGELKLPEWKPKK